MTHTEQGHLFLHYKGLFILISHIMPCCYKYKLEKSSQPNFNLPTAPNFSDIILLFIKLMVCIYYLFFSVSLRPNPTDKVKRESESWTKVLLALVFVKGFVSNESNTKYL